jgi:large subunit ribosomal protein L32
VPVPKRRTTPSKRNMRRANHDKVAAPNLVPCSNCSAPSLPHRVCAACGFYGKRAIVQKDTDTATDTTGSGGSR